MKFLIFLLLVTHLGYAEDTTTTTFKGVFSSIYKDEAQVALPMAKRDLLKRVDKTCKESDQLSEIEYGLEQQKSCIDFSCVGHPRRSDICRCLKYEINYIRYAQAEFYCLKRPIYRPTQPPRPRCVPSREIRCGIGRGR